MKLWRVHEQEGYSLTKVVAEVVNIKGEMPGKDESIAEVGGARKSTVAAEGRST